MCVSDTCTHMCAHQGIRNVDFSENFVYVLNGWPNILLKESCPSADIFLATPPAYEDWCYQICSQHDKLFSKYYKKAVSATIESIFMWTEFTV